MLNIHASGPFGLVVLVFLISGYFTPSVVAAARGRSSLGIFLLNLFLGWTFVAWLVALYVAARDADRGVAEHREKYRIERGGVVSARRRGSRSVSAVEAGLAVTSPGVASKRAGIADW